MKNFFITSLSATILLFTSCSESTYPTSSDPYPGGQNPYPGGQNPYPNEPVVIGQDGRVINRDGRQARSRINLPPGQAKKVYGGQSAKVYAPGQQKKNGGGVYQNLPPNRIAVNDRNAKRAANGQYYYTDRNGYVYWKANDGYYYLDSKYNRTNTKNNKHGNGKNNYKGNGKGKSKH